MSEAKWYLVCDRINKRALDLIVLPDTWGKATGLRQQSDEDLEFFWQWSPHPETNFLTVDRARELEYDAASIDSVLSKTQPVMLAWVRAMRDPLLQATDAIIVADRWESLNVVQRNDAMVYRTALRNLTEAADLFNITWPAIPPVLDFVRKINISGITQPSASFLASLVDPYPEPSLVQRAHNQWLYVKEERDRRMGDGVKVAIENVDHWFYTDLWSRTQYVLLDSQGVRLGAQEDDIVDEWKTMAGDYVPITYAMLHDIIDAGIAQEKAIFKQAELHRQAINASSTPETYDYTTGWPATFSG